MLKKMMFSLISSAILLSASSEGKVPDLEMKDTKLSFKEIEDYQNYKIVATHFRTDKNEIRYILANPVAYNALRDNKVIMPDGSKIVKIGWSVRKMPTFQSALEADMIQRVEYMIKDKTKHKESDGWGYARFVKKDGVYKPWDGDINSCVSCHAIVESNDSLFTKFQHTF
jgi:Cytochrome P460